jgi:hypothetical protein
MKEYDKFLIEKYAENVDWLRIGSLAALMETSSNFQIT